MLRRMAWGTPFSRSRMPASIEKSLKLVVCLLVAPGIVSIFVAPSRRQDGHQAQNLSIRVRRRHQPHPRGMPLEPSESSDPEAGERERLGWRLNQGKVAQSLSGADSLLAAARRQTCCRRNLSLRRAVKCVFWLSELYFTGSSAPKRRACRIWGETFTQDGFS